MSKETKPQTLVDSAASMHEHRPDPKLVHRALAKRSFATIATTSPAGWPHVAGVIYEFVDGKLYINTMRNSRKARNIAANSHVAIVVPIRRVPVGPPSTIQFQGDAEILAVHDPEITALIAKDKLKAMTGHGELELADSCFVRVSFGPKVLTYGLGMSLPALIKAPLSAGGSAEIEVSR